MTSNVNNSDALEKELQSVKLKINDYRNIIREKNQIEAEINLSLAELNYDIKKCNNTKLMKEYTLTTNSNYDVLKKTEIDKDASQLIKINKIKEYVKLGWTILLHIRKYKPKMDRFDIDEANSNFGSIDDRINLDSYIVSRMLAKNNIFSITNDRIKENVTMGLKPEHITSAAIKELTDGEKDKQINQTNRLFWIRHRAIKNDVNKLCTKIKNSNAYLTQIVNNINKISDQLEDILSNKSQLNIDEAIVFDCSFAINRLLDIVQLENGGSYEYGVFPANDKLILDKALDELLSEIK